MKVDLTALEGFEPPGSIPNVAKKRPSPIWMSRISEDTQPETVAAVRKYTLEYR